MPDLLLFWWINFNRRIFKAGERKEEKWEREVERDKCESRHNIHTREPLFSEEPREDILVYIRKIVWADGKSERKAQRGSDMYDRKGIVSSRVYLFWWTTAISIYATLPARENVMWWKCKFRTQLERRIFKTLQLISQAELFHFSYSFFSSLSLSSPSPLSFSDESEGWY